MTIDLTLEDFEYFVDAYFNHSRDYSDLEYLIERYKTNEKKQYIDGLLNDVNLLIQLNNWDYVRKFIIKHGKRHLSREKVESMVNLLAMELSKE